jgi:predicted small lipoprotein YifL
MLKTFKKGLTLQLAIVVVLAFLFSGCGKKAPPKPPPQEKASSVNNLIIPEARSK